MSQKIDIVKATLKDERTLWEWRNHPEVRKQCFDTDVLPLEKHKQWFAEKLKDSQTYIFMAVCEKEKIGVVRFECMKEETAISVYLNPQYIGQGLGSLVIREATEIFDKEHPDGGEIKAHIKKDNIVSQKSFLKAGYVFKDQKSGEAVYVYSRGQKI